MGSRRHRPAMVRAWLALLVIAASVAVGAASPAAAGEDRAVDPIPFPRSEVARARADAERRESWLRSAEARERRRESRAAFRGLTRVQAIAAARETHAPVFGAEPWDGPDLRSDQTIRRFVGGSAALIAQGSSEVPLLLESTLPLRFREDGKARLIDLTPTRGANGFVPAASPVTVEMPMDAGEGVWMRQADLRVVGGAGGDEAAVTGDKVLWANVAPDTDFAVAPRVDGLETYHLLRSPASPERLELEFSSDQGGLAFDPDPLGGGRRFHLLRGAARVATIDGFAAWDAQGRAVPVEVSSEGSRVVMSVAHRTADWAYPIVVDPYVVDGKLWEDQQYWDGHCKYDPSSLACKDQRKDRTGWGFDQCCGADSTFRYGFETAGYPHVDDGLYIMNNDGNYDYGDQGNWRFPAPGQTSVVEAHFNFLQGYWLGPPRACVIVGTVQTSPYMDWENRWHQCFTDFRGNQVVICEPGQAGNCHAPLRPSTRQNQAVMSLWMDGPYRTLVGQWARGSFGGAIVVLKDYENPTLTSLNHAWKPGNPNGSNWVRGGTGRADIAIYDPGIGSRSLSITHADRNGGTKEVWGIFGGRPYACEGDRNDRCWPGLGSWGVEYKVDDMPEGIVSVNARGYDAVGRMVQTTASDADPTKRPWQVKVDRTAPTLSVSGPLRDGVGLDSLDDHGLAAVAIDGDPNDPGPKRRSGTASLKLYVANELVAETYSDASCIDSCALRFFEEETFADIDRLPEGSHPVVVEAVDRAGNVAREPWTIEVRRENHFAQSMLDWKADVERRVDDAVPLIGLTGPMPSPPTDWQRGRGACTTSEAEVDACYGRIRQWGRDVLVWLRNNLVAQTGEAEDLPNPPTFDYSVADDTQRDLTFATRDVFAAAKTATASPADLLAVGVSFRAPIDGATLRGLLPELATSAQTVLFRGGHTGAAGGMSSIAAPALPDPVEAFYVRQQVLASRIAEDIEADEKADAAETAADAEALVDWETYRDTLAARGPAIEAVVTEISSARLLALLAEATLVKSIAPITSEESRTGALARRMTDRETVLIEGSTTAARSSSRPSSRPACSSSELGNFRSLNGPSPALYAPSRFSGRSQRVEDDDSDNAQNKRHFLAWQWQADGGLRWMCAQPNGERNVEIEAKVHPRVDDGRWSSNWERDFDVAEDLPGPPYLDDLNRGGNLTDNPTANQYYQDYAILSRHSHAFNYAQRYTVVFQTNEGDMTHGSVIYRAQATYLARTRNQKRYCNGRDVLGVGGYDGPEKDYEHCMFGFGQTVTCYGLATILSAGSGPADRLRRRVDWRERLGAGNFTLRDADRGHDSDIELDDKPEIAGDENGPGGQVVTFCDPSPPGDR